MLILLVNLLERLAQGAKRKPTEADARGEMLRFSPPL